MRSVQCILQMIQKDPIVSMSNQKSSELSLNGFHLIMPDRLLVIMHDDKRGVSFSSTKRLLLQNVSSEEMC